MKGEWKVTSQYIGDEKVYQVYRLRNVNEVDHGGNREYVPKFTTNSKEEAIKMANKMNNECE